MRINRTCMAFIVLLAAARVLVDPGWANLDGKAPIPDAAPGEPGADLSDRPPR